MEPLRKVPEPTVYPREVTTTQSFKTTSPAKIVATVMGAVLVAIGPLGFLVPNLFGMHLSPVHNVIHLVSGIASIFFGLQSDRRARFFCLGFGVVYSLLGTGGYVLGAPTGEEANYLQVLPNMLELGSHDHGVHALIGIIYIVAGLLKARTKA